jgi:DNA-binding transcriptional LysR family regulator
LHRPGDADVGSLTPPNKTAGSVELRELRYFAVLCEELHFGRAAERLHMSQSPLSQSIGQLERKIGARLLDRSSRHVHLTVAGQVLLEHARRLLAEADAAVGATRRAGNGERGSLRIAAGLVCRAAILPALLREVDDRFPRLGVEIAEDVGERLVDGVLRGASDVGLVLCAPARDDVEAKLLRRDRPIAVMHPGHPLAGRRSVTIDALAEHTLVLWSSPSSKGSQDVVLSMFNGRQPASTRVADVFSGAFWDAMLAGGFTIVAHSAAVTGDFVAVPIDDTTAEFSMSMVWSRQTPPAVLPGLVEAADAAIVANGWL